MVTYVKRKLEMKEAYVNPVENKQVNSWTWNKEIDDSTIS